MSILRFDTTNNRTLEEATALANLWSSRAISNPEYNTPVKNEHGFWIVTNKFDPRVARAEKEKNNEN
jgi:hypothetical protein